MVPTVDIKSASPAAQPPDATLTAAAHAAGAALADALPGALAEPPASPPTVTIPAAELEDIHSLLDVAASQMIDGEPRDLRRALFNVTSALCRLGNYLPPSAEVQ